RKLAEAAVPKAVQLKSVARHEDEELIAAHVAVLVVLVHSRRAVERLVYVADVVDEETQRLRALVVVCARLQDFDVASEGLYDVNPPRQVSRDFRPVRAERKVREV